MAKAPRENVTCTGATTRVTLTVSEVRGSRYEGMAGVLFYPDQKCMDEPRRYFRINGPILLLDRDAAADNPDFLKLAGQRVRVSGIIDPGGPMQVVSRKRTLTEREVRPMIMRVKSVEPESPSAE